MQHKNAKRRLKKNEWMILIITCVAAVVLMWGFFTKPKEQDHVEMQLSVNMEVLEYKDLVKQYTTQQDISDYEDVVLAMIQQESSGLGTDVMQCSECPYNTDYPQTRGSITDPEYSVSTGIRYFAHCLSEANCENPSDYGRLRLALQGYNFGSGYIPWALNRYGGYTKESAVAFSEMMQEELGWDNYGDTSYPEHVLRYLNIYSEEGNKDE